ncbi:MAG: HAD family hydrolase [Verrucomicrobiae bacterium]|nr:HAD family hydrolase [Verrucomicrobiae bacterium]
MDRKHAIQPCPSKRRAVFLDRDDTLIPDIPYLGDPGRVTLLPGARDALLRLQRAGFLLVMVSNQSGIARGLLTHDQVQSVNRMVARHLHPARLDAIYYSPDGPNAPSETRKPAPGLLLLAAREHDIDLARSFMIGDKASDVACGRAAGCRTVRITTVPPPPTDPLADFTAPDLKAATDWILAPERVQ